jgi:hypothetical protein
MRVSHLRLRSAVSMSDPAWGFPAAKLTATQWRPSPLRFFMKGSVLSLPDCRRRDHVEASLGAMPKDTAALCLKNSNAKNGNGPGNGSARGDRILPGCTFNAQRVSARCDRWLAGRICWRTGSREKPRYAQPAVPPGSIPQHGMDKPPFRCTRKLRLCCTCKIAVFWTFRRQNIPSRGKVKDAADVFFFRPHSLISDSSLNLSDGHHLDKLELTRIRLSDSDDSWRSRIGI